MIEHVFISSPPLKSIEMLENIFFKFLEIKKYGIESHSEKVPGDLIRSGLWVSKASVVVIVHSLVKAGQ